MPRTGRLLELLQALRESRTPVTARSLAERFAVSERTIHRDLATLQSLGAPIEGEAGVGFVLQPGFFLAPMSLTQTEADAIRLGLRFVSVRSDTAMAEAACSALAKISASMNADTEAAMRLNGLTAAPSGSGRLVEVAAIRAALNDERKLHIAYEIDQGETSDRIVWPIALGFFGQTEMMAAWCERREAFRHFRVDRIQALRPLEDRLPRARRTLLAAYRRLEPGADL